MFSVQAAHFDLILFILSEFRSNLVPTHHSQLHHFHRFLIADHNFSRALQECSRKCRLIAHFQKVTQDFQ